MTNPTDGYSLIPDGIWTCNLSPGAIRLLGWIWTGPDDTVSGTEIREQFGNGVLPFVHELTMSDYIEAHDSGDRLIYERIRETWEGLV